MVSKNNSNRFVPGSRSPAQIVDTHMKNIIELFQDFTDKLTYVRPRSLLAQPLHMRLPQHLDETCKWIVSDNDFIKDKSLFLLHDFGTHQSLPLEDVKARKLHYGFADIGDSLCVPFKVLHTGLIGFAPVAFHQTQHELSALVRALEFYDTQPLFIHAAPDPHPNNNFTDPSQNGIIPAIGSVGCSALQIPAFDPHDHILLQWAQTFCNTYPLLHPKFTFANSTFIISGRKLNASNTREHFLSYYFCTNGHTHNLDHWITKCLTHLSDTHSITGYEGTNERCNSPQPWASLVSAPKPISRHAALKNVQLLLSQLPIDLQDEGQNKLFGTSL